MINLMEIKMESETERKERKRRDNLRTWLILIGFPLVCYWFWNWNPVEDYVGSWMAFVDPKRSEHLDQRLQKKSDATLLKLLHHGDMNKAESAKVILARRAKPELFDKVVRKLNDHSQEVRERARILLVALDRDRAIKLYMQELDRLPKDSDEYRQTLSILAHMKYEPVFPYLVGYAKNDLGNKEGASVLLEDFGDPRAIPVLEEMLQNMPQPDSFEEKRIKRAIEKLQAIAPINNQGRTHHP